MYWVQIFKGTFRDNFEIVYYWFQCSEIWANINAILQLFCSYELFKFWYWKNKFEIFEHFREILSLSPTSVSNLDSSVFYSNQQNPIYKRRRTKTLNFVLVNTRNVR